MEIAMKDKSLMKKLSVLLPAGMMLITAAVSGCSNAGSADVNQNETDETMPSIPEDLRGGSPWMDSCIAGNVTADTETSAADDFCLYVNKDWITSRGYTDSDFRLW